MKIKTIIVEDEQKVAESLEQSLKEYCSDVKVVASCLTGEDALRSIDKHKPELVFMDMNLGGGWSGIDVIEQAKFSKFGVVFISQYDEYAVQVINKEIPSISYIKKPIAGEQLSEAVDKYKIRRQRQQDKGTRLEVSLNKEFSYIRHQDIIYCKASDNYTEIFYMLNGEQKNLLVSVTLKKITERLPHSLFCRIQKSYVINMEKVNSVIREGYYVILDQAGDKIPIGPKYLKDFFDRLRGL